MSESQRIEVSTLSVTGAMDVLDDASRQTTVSAPPSFDPDRPKAGTVLEERYEVGELLGEGGMGYVLAARHVVLGTRLALKVLRRELTRDAEMVERFRREARAASAIGHPNIVEVRDFGTLPSSDHGAPGASYFVMEHLEGQGLAEALEADGPFSLERAIDVVRQMADALEAAHAQGIVHRDVKPENVILTVRNGRPDHVKILDFGIAKLDSAVRLSGAFRVLGTPAYMSPEQAQGRPLDHRSDVYSLGIVLYELLTGTLPFDDPRPMEVIRQQVTVLPPSVLALRPDVPDVVAETIARALEKDREKRPTSMRAMMDMLASFAVTRSAEFRRGAGVSTPPSAAATLVDARRSTPAPSDAAFAQTAFMTTPPFRASTPAPIARRARPSRWWWALAAIGVLALGAAAAIGGAMELRAVERPAPAATAQPPQLPAAIVAAPVIAAPPVAAPEPVVITLPIASAPVVAAPSPVVHPHAHPSSVVAPAPVAAPAPVEGPVAAPQPDSRPTAQVIDPWN
jgi:serine/threonine protein kinase